MSQISIVIITKNEALNIVDCILSARKVSNDIIVIDSGSTDDTVLLAEQQQVTVRSVSWKGYGNARNIGALLATNNWILALDADERITDELAASIARLDLSSQHIVYGFKRLNYFGDQKIRHGALGHDRVFRLYNKNHSFWNAVPVHETLVGNKTKKLTLNSHAEHYGIRTEVHYLQKKMRYAYLCALKYKEEKRRFSAMLLVLSPAFDFIKSYLFQLGFLDKRIGFIVARINANYTRKKYEQLQKMEREEVKPALYNFSKTNVKKSVSF